jgi:hypothetical protein
MLSHILENGWESTRENTMGGAPKSSGSKPHSPPNKCHFGERKIVNEKSTSFKSG